MLSLSLDGLGCNLAVCGGTERGPWPGHRRGFLHDDRHLSNTKVQFLSESIIVKSRN